MSDFLTPDRTRQEFLRRSFVDEALGDELFAVSRDSWQQDRVSPSVLYEIAQGHRPLGHDIERAFDQYPHLRALYICMIEAVSVFYFGEARAASAGDIVRTIAGCRIWMEKSQAEVNQVYVIIEFEEEDPGVNSLIIVDQEKRITSFELPSTRHKICQMIVEQGDELLSLLNDPKTVVYLR